MIEGIRIELTTDELRNHLRERAEYHKQKYEWYRDKAQDLKDAGSEGKSNDPAASLRSSARNHENQQAFFAFLEAHLIADETYRLSEVDFIKLEFAARYAF